MLDCSLPTFKCHPPAINSQNHAIHSNRPTLSHRNFHHLRNKTKNPWAPTNPAPPPSPQRRPPTSLLRGKINHPPQPPHIHQLVIRILRRRQFMPFPKNLMPQDHRIFLSSRSNLIQKTIHHPTISQMIDSSQITPRHSSLKKTAFQ